MSGRPLNRSTSDSVVLVGSRARREEAAEAGVHESAHEGPAASRRPNKLWSVCIFILIVEMCERLCYYTLGGSQRNFLEVAGPVRDGQRGMQASSAVSLSSCWSMLSYLFCMLGGYIADNRLGRYRTILYFALSYTLGVVLVAISAYPRVLSSEASQPVYLIGMLVFVAIGTGAIKPNVMNFGADQYDTTDPKEREQQKNFFSYFYLAINLGSLGANGFTANLATSMSTASDPGFGYFYSYLIAAAAMGIAFVTFAAGTSRYGKTGGVQRSPMFSAIISCLVSSAKVSCKGVVALWGWCLLPSSMMVVLVGSLMSNLQHVSSILTWVGMGVALGGSGLLIVAHLRNNYIVTSNGLDVAPSSERAVSSDDVRGALACVPTIVCVNLGFNIVYNAMNNAYPAQACQMDVRFFGKQLNGAFFGLGDSFAIILFVPIVQGLVLPGLKKLRGGRPVSRWAQYTAGFGFGILANLSAAYIEHIRRGMSVGDKPNFVPCPAHLLGTAACEKGYLLSKCSPNASLPMTNMSAFWTFVPMTLTGLGEILVNPVIYQFVFERSPARLCSTVQALNLVVAGAVSNAVTAGLGPLVPNDMNVGNINTYYYTNVGLASLGLLVYWYVAGHDDVCEDSSVVRASPEAPESSVSAGPLLAGSLLASEHGGASLVGSQHRCLFAGPAPASSSSLAAASSVTHSAA